MARTSNFTYTNIAASTATVAKVQIKENTDYGVIADEPTMCSMSNLTAPVGQDEIISNFCEPIKRINSKVKVANPGPEGGIQYGVRIDSVLVTTDTADTTYELDEPIVVQISVRHPRSSNFTAQLVNTAVRRAVSAFFGQNNAQAGMLMRSALQPMADYTA